MNIKQVNSPDKGVSATNIFKTENSSALAIQILKGELLKEHLTKTPALLLCVFGEVIFENEKGENVTLVNGDFINIEPMVKHWVKGVSDSQLILVK